MLGEGYDKKLKELQQKEVKEIPAESEISNVDDMHHELQCNEEMAEVQLTDPNDISCVRPKQVITVESADSKKGFAVAFDNIDIRQERKNMTKTCQNRDEHWVNHEAVFNRISGNEYPNENPIAEVIDVPNKTFLPNINDQRQQRYNYIILTSRILVQHFSAFQCFKDVCVTHIPHQYTKEVSTKSEKVTQSNCLLNCIR